MPSQDTADDDDVRQSYNFAPGYYGLVYRADARPPSNASTSQDYQGQPKEQEQIQTSKPPEETTNEPIYRLQAMKWGLVPFWTKKNPGYGSLMKTINCRDDSLAQAGGMWQHVKKKNRCIVIAQGFYEWLKKNDGKEKIPHYVKRKDGQLMCFAGLWDHAKFEDSEKDLYTYTIITTSSNKQLSFLHDRMPVILNNGSAELFQWLDASKQEWTADLQSLLQPYAGELECYPVSKDVGKVGNNSASFVIPLDENKQSINNFFANQKRPEQKSSTHSDKLDKATNGGLNSQSQDADGENNAPKPMSKRNIDTTDAVKNVEEPSEKRQRTQSTPSSSASKLEKSPMNTPTKNAKPLHGAKDSPDKSKSDNTNMKITNFLSR